MDLHTFHIIRRVLTGLPKDDTAVLMMPVWRRSSWVTLSRSSHLNPTLPSAMWSITLLIMPKMSPYHIMPSRWGPLYFLTPRKVQIFGVAIEGEKKQINYLIDENETIVESPVLVDIFNHNHGKHID